MSVDDSGVETMRGNFWLIHLTYSKEVEGERVIWCWREYFILTLIHTILNRCNNDQPTKKDMLRVVEVDDFSRWRNQHSNMMRLKSSGTVWCGQWQKTRCTYKISIAFFQSFFSLLLFFYTLEHISSRKSLFSILFSIKES